MGTVKVVLVALCIAFWVAVMLLTMINFVSTKTIKGGLTMGEYNVTQLKTEEGWQRAVTIPELRFLELEEAEATLNKLYAAGVDNWDGYDDAVGED